MLLKIVFLHVAVMVCVFAAPSTDVVPLEKQQPTVIPILEQSEELEPNGTYKFSYETGNGIKREEISYDKVLPRTRNASPGSENDEQNDEDNEIHVQQGSYFYTAPDGTLISLRYIADENGFQPIGDHLPKPPPIFVAARSSGRRAKTADNAEGGSAPLTVVAAALEAPTSSKDSKAPEAPVLESRIRELSSAARTSTSTLEGESSTTPEASSTTEVTSTTELPVSTTESASTTTEQLSSTEVISTEPPKTSEAALTPESTIEPFTTGDPSSTAAASSTNATSDKSTSSSEATTKTVTTVSA